MFKTSKLISISLHQNKKSLKSMLSWKIFLIENEYKTPIGCLIFIFYQKYFLWQHGLKVFLFWCDNLGFPNQKSKRKQSSPWCLIWSLSNLSDAYLFKQWEHWKFSSMEKWKQNCHFLIHKLIPEIDLALNDHNMNENKLFTSCYC